MLDEDLRAEDHEEDPAEHVQATAEPGAELSADRRAELIAISDEIAAEYTCDPRLCE